MIEWVLSVILCFIEESMSILSERHIHKQAWQEMPSLCSSKKNKDGLFNLHVHNLEKHGGLSDGSTDFEVKVTGVYGGGGVPQRGRW